MAVSAKSLGIDRLPIEDRLALVEEIWAGIRAEESRYALTEAQRTELDRRADEDDAYPNEVTPWDEIKSGALRRLER